VSLILDPDRIKVHSLEIEEGVVIAQYVGALGLDEN
jgi:hypothetical protein